MIVIVYKLFNNILRGIYYLISSTFHKLNLPTVELIGQIQPRDPTLNPFST